MYICSMVPVAVIDKCCASDPAGLFDSSAEKELLVESLLLLPGIIQIQDPCTTEFLLRYTECDGINRNVLAWS